MRPSFAAHAAQSLVVAYAPRGRARALARSAVARRSGRLVLARSAQEFATAFHHDIVDAALVDLGAGEQALGAAELAREYPSVAFFGITALRASDGYLVGRCADLDFCDLLVEGVDDGSVRELVAGRGFSARFATALQIPPATLGLNSDLHLDTWRILVARAGRTVRTSDLAKSLSMTREHLSRSFAAHGNATLKRAMDLVRLLAAAELAKNPGYDMRDLARVLRFASPAHLSATAERVLGSKPSSLAALRTVDLLERFARKSREEGGGRRPAKLRARESPNSQQRTATSPTGSASRS